MRKSDRTVSRNESHDRQDDGSEGENGRRGRVPHVRRRRDRWRRLWSDVPGGVLVVVVVLVEAQLRHVLLDAATVVVFETVTLARGQLGGLLLAAQDRDRVVAPGGALLPVEHRPAVLVVVLEGGGALGVRGADPLGHPTRHHRRPDRLHHLWAADFRAELLVLAVLVAALALQITRKSEAQKEDQEKKKVKENGTTKLIISGGVLLCDGCFVRSTPVAVKVYDIVDFFIDFL